MPLRFERLSVDLLLLTLGACRPSARDWQAWLHFVEAGHYSRPRVIVHSAGGGPDATQRRALADVMRAYPSTKVAVMVDSVLGRGIVTALGWLYGGFSAFGTKELGRALEYLDVAPGMANAISGRIDALRVRGDPSAPSALKATPELPPPPP
jgi:hypothetical protein